MAIIPIQAIERRRNTESSGKVFSDFLKNPVLKEFLVGWGTWKNTKPVAQGKLRVDVKAILVDFHRDPKKEDIVNNTYLLSELSNAKRREKYAEKSLLQTEDDFINVKDSVEKRLSLSA